MKRIWAPWRIPYLKGPKEEVCVFCDRPGRADDARNLILHRGERVFVIMNLYPYTNGHLMIVPYDHTSSLDEVSAEAAAEAFALLQHCRKALVRVMHPQGFNVGVNLGKAAGAGIDEHVHLHIVPRWVGDTNFMPVLAETRVISEHIESTYVQLKPYFEDFSLVDRDEGV